LSSLHLLKHFPTFLLELMFSLSYLPTAERLTIVVVKARNLKLEPDAETEQQRQTQSPNAGALQHVFVKVSKTMISQKD